MSVDSATMHLLHGMRWPIDTPARARIAKPARTVTTSGQSRAQMADQPGAIGVALVASAEGMSFSATLRLAVDALGAAEAQPGLAQLPTSAILADNQALPPGYLATLLRLLDREQRKRLIGQRFTSRIEARNGYLFLYLRLDHLIEQLACPDQPKIVLDGTAHQQLLEAIFPHTPIRVEQPTIAGTSRVIQVIGQDWAKTTLQGQRLERWYDAITAHIRPDRPTLVVTTLEWEAEVCEALRQRGHAAPLVQIGHYGGLRGSNAYKGFDVVLAQVYNPNLEQVIRTARALFADDHTPLDERIVLENRTLTDSTGASWRILRHKSPSSPACRCLVFHRRSSALRQARQGATLAASVQPSTGCLRQPNSCWMVAGEYSTRP